MNATIGLLTDSSAGVASATTVAALSDGSTYANDVVNLRANLATLTLAANQLIRAVAALQSQGAPE